MATKTNNKHEVIATSFADPHDIERFRRCKDAGNSNEECFKVGDNGIGLWGDDCSEKAGPICALPPDDMVEKWGSINAAKHKPVQVNRGDLGVICTLKDRMPWKKNIKNGAGIDLNPDACNALGLKPPVLEQVVWFWVDSPM